MTQWREVFIGDPIRLLIKLVIIYCTIEVEIEFMPWLLGEVEKVLDEKIMACMLLDGEFHHLYKYYF